jgi:hypothetical protein
MLRSVRMATMGECAGAILIAASVGVGAAAADDKWQLTVTNSGDIPVKVVVLDAASFKDITDSRSPEFIPKGSGTVKVKQKGSYHVEVFAKGDPQPCWKQRGFSASTSSVTVRCDHTMTKAPTAETPNVHGGPPQGGGQPPSSSGSSLGNGQPPKTPVLYPQPSGKCSMTEIRSDGTCPPKAVNDDLGNPKPGAPVRTDKPLDTTPVPPGKPAKPAPVVVQEKLHLPCPPGAPEDPKDSKGDKSGVSDGKAGGLNCTTNVGGGKK